jgi:HIND motif
MSTSTDASNGIKAMVTDENGEISCSVDETNRIRALLGLRPLNNEKGSNEREAVQNFYASREKERRFAVLSILLLYSLPYQIDIFVGRRRLRSLGRSWRRLERKEFLVRK